MYDNLRKVREKSGFTQEEISELLTKNAYSLKERGERKITLEEAQKLSEIFGMSIEEIFFKNEVTNMLIK